MGNIPGKSEYIIILFQGFAALSSKDKDIHLSNIY